MRTGDFVIAKVEGFDDGKPLPGRKLEPPARGLRQAPSRTACDEVLIGAEVGRRRRAARRLSEQDYAQKELAGKTSNGARRSRKSTGANCPTLDDEFAKDKGDSKTSPSCATGCATTCLSSARQEADAQRAAGTARFGDRAQSDGSAGVAGRARAPCDGSGTDANAARPAGIAPEQAAERVQESPKTSSTRAEKRARCDADPRRAGGTGKDRGQRRGRRPSGSRASSRRRAASAIGSRRFYRQGGESRGARSSRCGARRRST